MTTALSSLEVLVENPPVLGEDGKKYEKEGREFDRVTNVIHKALPPYLTPWAEKVGREAVMKLYALNGGNLPSDPEEVAEEVKTQGWTTEAEKKSGGLRGAEIHFAMEAWIKQGVPPTLSDFEPEVRPYAQTLAQFLVDYEPEFEAAEIMLYEPELRYAGTCDAIGKVTKRPKGARHPEVTGKRLVFDFKTNKNKAVYDQHYAQLAAYEYALASHDVQVDGSAVVAIGPHGIPGSPYRFAVNYWEAEDWLPVIGLYRALENVKQKNPNKRKK